MKEMFVGRCTPGGFPTTHLKKKSRVRYTAHTARDASKTTVVVHICFCFDDFFKLLFGCLQLNFKQPIGAPENRFLDSSRHLTRQVLSSIYVLHLKFLYGYRKKLLVISEGVPFSTPPWCKIWFSSTFSCAGSKFESPIFSKDFWPPHCWELATCRWSQVVWWWRWKLLRPGSRT